MICVRLRTVAVVGTQLLIVVGLAACGSGGNGAAPWAGAGSATSSTDSTSLSPPTPAPRPSPTPTSVAPAVYQQALTDLDAALGPGYLAIGAALTPADTSAAASAVATNIEVQLQTLDDIRPPRAVATAHDDLASALAALATDLRTLTSDANSYEVCTGGSGLPRATSGEGGHLMRLAATALATADPTNPYTVGAFLPAGSPEPNRRPANGNLGTGRRGGYGELTVTTSLDTDAVVKLTEGDSVVRTVYVQGGTSATANGLPDGSFVAYYTTGTDWDDTNKRFTRDCDFSKFDDPLPYTTRYLSTEIQYTTFDLTLYEVVGGNASVSGVDPNAFPSG